MALAKAPRAIYEMAIVRLWSSMRTLFHIVVIFCVCCFFPYYLWSRDCKIVCYVPIYRIRIGFYLCVWLMCAIKILFFFTCPPVHDWAELVRLLIEHCYVYNMPEKNRLNTVCWNWREFIFWTAIALWNIVFKNTTTSNAKSSEVEKNCAQGNEGEKDAWYSCSSNFLQSSRSILFCASSKPFDYAKPIASFKHLWWCNFLFVSSDFDGIRLFHIHDSFYALYTLNKKKTSHRRADETKKDPRKKKLWPNGCIKVT